MSHDRRSTRRQFLKHSTLAAAGAIAAPYIVPASALGRDGATAPSERITMGCVGMGGKGTNNMQTFLRNKDVQVVAVCDVERESNLYHGGGTYGVEPARRLVEQFYGEQTQSGEYNGCKAYHDFRELVARDDIDAVSVATPDHWHALITIAALEAGKDVYCEKPLSNSVGEGRAICRAAARNDRLVQTGSHERSGGNARFAAELVHNGFIGRLHTLRINLPCDDGHHQDARSLTDVPAEMPVPEGFDYDFWLGHTPLVPYTPRRCHFWWRFILAYGGGEMTDRGAHVIDLAQLGGGFDDTGPVEFEAEGIQTKNGLYDAYWDYRFVNTYANGVKMIGDTEKPRGVKFEGDDGWIFVHVHGQKLEAEPASLLKETISDDGVQLGRSPGHHRNFLDCVKSREQPLASAEIGHRTATICHLNNLAMRLGRTLKWDPVNEQVVGDPEANRLLTPEMRDPWQLALVP